MPLLPPELSIRPPHELVDVLRQPAERTRLRSEWFPQVQNNPSLGPDWPDMLTIAHTAAPEFAWAHGLTLAQIAREHGTDPIEAALDILVASGLNTNVIMAVQNQRPPSDLGKLISHPRHMGGSDGIFIGHHPHPRSRGAFASYLGTYTRELGFLDWTDAVRHLATAPVERFHLGRRGRVRPGYIADIAIVDPGGVRDTATYDEPMRVAEGIDDVIVGGKPVLADGRLTGALPGGGLRAESLAA